MANLGDLTYTLGLNDTDFNRKIQDAARQVGVLDSSVRNVVQSLNGLKDISINISGIPKDVGTTNVSLVAGNIDQFRSQVESALQGMQISGLSVDVSSVKSQLQSQLVDIRVTLSNDGVQDLLRRIKEKVGMQRITVKVTPDWSRNAIRNLQNSMQTQMRNLDIKGVKLTIDRAKVQSELSRAPFYAELQLKVNRSTVSETIQSAVNQQGNLTNEERKTKEATQQTNEERKKGAGWQKTISDHMRTTTQLATILGNTFGNVFGAYQLKRFLENLIQIGGEIQKQRMALGHLLGSEYEANVLFGQMKDLAVKSPFGLLDLTKNARQLTAFGVEYNNLYDTMKRLSDVAAGLGIQFGRLSLAYGETMERGFLDGKLVRQFAYMGLPVLQKIADYYNVINKLDSSGQSKLWSARDIREMVSNREIGFEDVAEVFKRMTDESGQFYNMQEVMAESVAGKWKNLKDALDIFYSDLAEGNSETLKMPAEIMTKLLKNYKDFEGAIVAVGIAMLGVKGASLLMARTMGIQSTEALRLIKSERELELTERRRQMALNGNVGGLVKSIRWRKQLTMEEVKASVTKNNLSYTEERELASKLKLNKANAQYLFELKLITKEQYKAVMSGNALQAKWTQMMYSVKGLGNAMALATAQAAEMIAVMMADPLTWVFAAVAAIGELIAVFDNADTKNKDITSSMSQAWKDLGSEVKTLSPKINIEFDAEGNLLSTEAEAQTAIDNMVTFLKDKMPGVQSVLDKVFERNISGQYVNSVKERIDILTEYYNAMKAISEDTTFDSFQSDINDTLGEHWYNYLFHDDLLRDAKDLEKATAEAKRNLKDAISDLGDQEDAFLKKWMKATNTKDMASLVNKVVEKRPDLFQSVVNDARKTGAWVGDITSIYTSKYNEFEKEFRKSNQKMEERLKGRFGQDFSLANFGKMPLKQQIEIQYAIRTWLESSSDSEWVKKHMVDKYKTAYNIDISLSGEYDKALSLLNYGGETLKDDNDNLRKAYKAAKERLKDYKENGLKGMTPDADGQYSYDGKDEYKKLAKTSANSELSKIRKMQEDGLKRGIDLEKEYQAELNKSGNKSKSNADEQLKQWKKQKSMYDDMLSTFKNLTSYMSKADALKKMRESGIWAGFLPEDAVDEESIKDLFKKLASEMEKAANTPERKDALSEVWKKIFSFDADKLKEESQRAVSIVEMEINKAAKQYDVWKSWFNATGNSEMAKNVALGITPQWDEHSTALLGIYADKFSEALGRKVDMTDIIFGQDMDEKTIKEMFGNNDAMVKAWKAIHDLIVSAGYDLSKKTADALKNMMSYTEKLNVLNKEREDALKGAATQGQREQINAYYDNKALEMSPEYTQFMSAVTSMTRDGAQKMADAIRDNLNRQLANGAIAVDKYADAIKKVDEQVKKSNERQSLLGALTKGVKEFGNELQTRYNNKTFLRGNAEKAVAEAKKNLDENPESVEALAKLAQAERNLETQKKEEEQAKALLDKFNLTQEKLGDFSAALSIATGVIDGITKAFDDLAAMFDALGDEGNANWFSDASDAIKAGSSFLTPVNNAVQSAMSGNVSGMISSAISAPFSMIANPIKGFAQLHDKRSQRQIDELKRMNTQLSNISGDLTRAFERNLGGVYTFKIDSELEKQMKEMGISTNDKSYYQGQLELLQAQRDNVQGMYDAEEGKKKTSKDALEDYREQLAELDDQIKNFALDMANTLYGIDFKSISENLASAIVSAWQQGTDAATAYKDAVEDILANVAQNVIQQKFIGAYLDDAIDPWLKQFEDNGGVMNGELFGSLANIFEGLEGRIDGSLQFMDAFNSWAEQHNYDLKQTDTSSLGASVSTVTEETADLLAGYISAMRADLSIQKEAILTFLGGSLHTMDDHYSMQESQLQQLRMIQSNTMRNADAAENIMSILDDVTNNRKQLNIA